MKYYINDDTKDVFAYDENYIIDFGVPAGLRELSGVELDAAIKYSATKNSKVGV